MVASGHTARGWCRRTSPTANTTPSTNIVLVWGHCRKRWPNNKPILVKTINQYWINVSFLPGVVTTHTGSQPFCQRLLINCARSATPPNFQVGDLIMEWRGGARFLFVKTPAGWGLWRCGQPFIHPPRALEADKGWPIESSFTMLRLKNG